MIYVGDTATYRARVVSQRGKSAMTTIQITGHVKGATSLPVGLVCNVSTRKLHKEQ